MLEILALVRGPMEADIRDRDFKSGVIGSFMTLVISSFFNFKLNMISDFPKY